MMSNSVMTPTSLPSPSTTGIPDIDCENSILAAFSTGISGGTVATSSVMMSRTMTVIAAMDISVSFHAC
jgi:hypothetical protein